MNAIALRSPPTGSNLDVAPTPTLVIWGDLDFPHIQERSRHMATVMLNGTVQVTSTAHLPSLKRPTDVTGLLVEFIDRFSGRAGKLYRVAK
jgi:pimeloyl-ACP methyl ester carboxylesterase